MENENPYKYQARKLVKKIKRIIQTSYKSPEDKSDEIMKALREEYILLPSNYINSFLYTKEQVSIFKNFLLSLDWEKEDERRRFMTEVSEDIFNKLNFSTHATINPHRIVRENHQGDVVKIKGNSFGPFNPQEYFNPDNIRILWLLKEPLIKKESWILKADRGGHPQADYYTQWSAIEDDDNKTLMNLVHRTQTILNVITNNGHIASEEEAMNHICILEVNHFPGLAFNGTDSDDTLIGQWAELNKELINRLIEFYAPTIIIGGNTTGHFYSSKKHDIASLKAAVTSGQQLLSDLGIEVRTIDEPKPSNSYIASGTYLSKKLDGDTVYIIDAYHPCPQRNKDYEYTDDKAKTDAAYIASVLQAEKSGVQTP